MKDNLTLEEHAYLWWKDRGEDMPSTDTTKGQAMYEIWVEWAFS